MTVGDLKKYKDGCYAALSRDLTEFEKNFLLIAGGILAFSTTFIKDIVQVSNAAYLILLFMAWALIIISIGLMMHSFLKSASASDLLMNTVDSFQLENNLYKEKTDLSNEQWLNIRAQIHGILSSSKNGLRSIRNWAVRLFLGGISCLAVFVFINLVLEKNKPNENKKEDKIEVVNGAKKITITSHNSKQN